MKKLVMLMMALCMAIGTFAAPELTKKQQKQVNKEVKAKMKEFKKDKWKVFGSSSTLENALNKHISTLTALDENGYEVVGTAGNFKSKNVGHQQAINSACVIYAGQAGSSLRGMTTADIKGNGSDLNDEFEHFYAAYQRNVEREIRSEMQESFSIIRETAPGIFELQTYFIINQDAAALARQRAAEAALNESEIAEEHAGKISDFVRKAFER